MFHCFAHKWCKFSVIIAFRITKGNIFLASFPGELLLFLVSSGIVDNMKIFFGYPFTNGQISDIISLVPGPVVQSVSTPACHAGGRRFESVPGRQTPEAFASGVFSITYGCRDSRQPYQTVKKASQSSLRQQRKESESHIYNISATV